MDKLVNLNDNLIIIYELFMHKITHIEDVYLHIIVDYQ